MDNDIPPYTPTGGDIQDGQIYGAPPRVVRRGNTIANATAAQDLHERAFGEKSQMDAARLTLAQSRVLAENAASIQSAALAKAKFQTEYRKSISGAALVEAVSALDPQDSNFKKNLAAVVARYPDGVETPGARFILGQQQADHATFQKAMQARDASTYTGQAADVFNKAFQDSGGNLAFANGMAKSEATNVERAQKAVSDPNLDPTLRNQLYDPKTGAFNTDPNLLVKAEIDTATKTAAAKAEDSSAAHIGAIGTALKAYNDIDLNKDSSTLSPADQARYAVKYNLTQAMQGASFKAAGAPGAAAATGAPDAVAGAFQKYLGAAAPAATPAASPPPAAGSPAPVAAADVPPAAPTPTPAVVVPPAAPVTPTDDAAASDFLAK